MKCVKPNPLPANYLSNYIPLKFITLLLLAFMMMLPKSTVDACMGTPVPPCGRSIFLAKFTPGVVVFPAGGGAINVPIGVLPFANWNTNGQCPQPTAATLTLTLTCFPSGNVIGPLAFPVPVPTVPGPQPVGGPVNFVIPAGTFPAGSPPQICLVVGTYSVTFSDNVTLSFTGDTEVCIVPPTPLDPAVPQLDMHYIPLNDGEDFRTCRRGDQANFYFLIANNDPDQSVSLDLSSSGRQVSQLPEGFTAGNAYANDVYAISLPQDSTDTFAAAFGDELLPGELLEEPDPAVPDVQLLTRSLTLGPCEATIICITMRSFGMCANGSCNERLVKVEGTFSGGAPALACASTLYLVGEVEPKSVLCEILDSVKVHPKGMANWSPTDYFGASGPFPHAQTFAVGNQENGGFLTSGDLLTGLFPSSASDYTRIDGAPVGMQYGVDYNSPQCGNGQNIVNIVGLDNQSVDFDAMPVITFQGTTSPLEIQIDLSNNQMVMMAQGDIVFQGPFDLFFVDPPPQFCIDPQICRVFRKRFDLSQKAVFAEPPVFSRLFPLPNTDPGCDTMGVYDNNMGMALWDAVVSGDGISLSAASGVGLLDFCYDNISALPKVPATTISFIDVSCPGALSPLRVPVAIRVKDTTVVSVDNPLEYDKRFVLHPARPNPFRTETQISYTLSEAAYVQLTIFNSQGQMVRQLVSPGRIGAGDYTITWDGKDNIGNLSANGLYFYQLQANDEVRISKVILTQ